MRATQLHPVQATPNVTPMIDVMLVLLVVFMVAAPALLVGIPAVPPTAAHALDRPEAEQDQVLGIDRVGGLYLNKRPITRQQLPGALRSIYSRRTIDKVLYVRADKDAQYGRVLDAVDLAGKNGVAVVGMISEKPTDTDVGRGP
jgi:biopolymer transport protein TolR